MIKSIFIGCLAVLSFASCGDTPQEGVKDYTDSTENKLMDTSNMPPVNYQQDSSSSRDTTALGSGKHGNVIKDSAATKQH